MKIVVNGDHVEVAVRDLEKILQSLGFQCTKVVVAVNQEFVSKEHWATYCVNERDQLDVLSPIEGG